MSTKHVAYPATFQRPLHIVNEVFVFWNTSIMLYCMIESIVCGLLAYSYLVSTKYYTNTVYQYYPHKANPERTTEHPRLVTDNERVY